MKFEKQKISNLISEISMGPFGSNIKVDCFVDKGIPVLNGSNLDGFALKEESFRFVTKEKADSLGKANAHRGDVVITHRGTLGQIIFIPGNSLYDRYVISQSQFRVRCNEKILPEYLVYYFHTKIGQHKLLSNASQVGVPALARASTTFQKLEIEVPDITAQQKIVSFLEIIRRKIEINTEINENLAEQAQGILYHFMDKHPYQLQPLSDIAIVIDCLHSKKPSSTEDSIYQLIQLDNIRDDGFLDLSATRYMISQTDYEIWTRKCEIIEGDCVITNVGRIGAVSQAPYGTKAAMGRNMTCIRLKPEIKLHAYFITVLLSNHMKRQIQGNTDEGTIMGALNVKNIPKLLFPIFESAVMTELEGVLFPLRKQIEYNNLQNQTLAQLRNVLLPKLMSGELDVSNFDI